MAANIPDITAQWQLAQRIGKQLSIMLKLKELPAIDDVEQCISDLRVACETVVFIDIDFATEHLVEIYLWDSHTNINNRYRKILANFRGDDHKRSHVEKRKWEKRYVDFLKRSQFFYKGFIQRLASHFDMSELRKIAHRLQLSSLSADVRINPSAEAEANALLSCHSTLLRLGDLSRYRNVIRSKDPSWDTALAYYALANDLCPDVGMAHNQMAVISVLDKDHLMSLYHLYRALAIEKPSPMAKGNLVIQFRKIVEEWTGPRKAHSRNTLSSGSDGLVTWFVRLHAKLYRGEDFPGHDELENEVLSQLQVTLREKPLEGTLEKFVLINMAAEYFAGERLRANPTPEHFQAYHFFLRLNIRMLFMLLQIIQPEFVAADESPDVTGKNRASTETVTAVTRRVLPSLRQYSTWLVTRAEIIVAQEQNTALAVHIREMWQMYASTLSIMLSSFPPEKCPPVDYLLEEDTSTVGFKPLRETGRLNNYTEGTDGPLKPRTTDPGVERNHPNAEMLSRFRDLLRDCMILSTNAKYPIQVVDGPSFQYIETALPASPPAFNGNGSVEVVGSQESVWKSSSDNHVSPPSGITPVHVIPSRFGQSVEPLVASEGSGLSNPAIHTRLDSPAPSDSCQSMSMSGDMYRMVDDLTTPTGIKNFGNGINFSDGQGTTYGKHSGTAFEAFGNKSTRSHQNPSNLFFGSSPFTPLPGELSLGQDRSLAVPRSGEDDFISAPKFDGLGSAVSSEQNMPWSTESFTSHAASGAVSQSPAAAVHSSDRSEERIPPSMPQSSAFTHNSSIYQGTPTRANNWRNVQRQAFPPEVDGGDITNDTGRRANGPTYSRGDNFKLAQMLQSSIWDGSQPVSARSFSNLPGGQGG